MNTQLSESANHMSKELVDLLGQQADVKSNDCILLTALPS